MKLALDRTQLVALVLAALFILFALQQVSGYTQMQPIVQGPADVDLSLYNSKVTQYNQTWASWLQGIISPGTSK